MRPRDGVDGECPDTHRRTAAGLATGLAARATLPAAVAASAQREMRVHVRNAWAHLRSPAGSLQLLPGGHPLRDGGQLHRVLSGHAAPAAARAAQTSFAATALAAATIAAAALALTASARCATTREAARAPTAGQASGRAGRRPREASTAAPLAALATSGTML